MAAAAADRVVFHTIVELGVGDGRLDLPTVRRLAAQLVTHKVGDPARWRPGR